MKIFLIIQKFIKLVLLLYVFITGIYPYAHIHVDNDNDGVHLQIVFHPPYPCPFASNEHKEHSGHPECHHLEYDHHKEFEYYTEWDIWVKDVTKKYAGRIIEVTQD